MRSRALSADHEAAVARRLELLTAELASVRGGSEVSDTRVRAASDDGQDGPVSAQGADSWSPSGYTRIRAVPDPEDWPDERVEVRSAPGSAPVPVPLPGRHAHRRFRNAWSAAVADTVPETLRGRVALAPGPLAVVAVIAAIGLAVACWWLVRGDSQQVLAPVAVSAPHAPLASPTGSAVAGAALPAATGASSPSTRVVVDVAGRVRRPGIAVLHSGARVVDAIRAAGGARPGVDLSALNLAQVVTDGQQIVVGSPTVPMPVPPSATSGGSPLGTLVNLNTADQTTLESLPEVGPVTAQAIIAWRTQHGGFSAVNQLLEVDGIGDATLAQLTPFVTI